MAREGNQGRGQGTSRGEWTKGRKGTARRSSMGVRKGSKGARKRVKAGGRWPGWPARGVEGSRDPYLEDCAGSRARVEWGMRGVKGVD